MYLAFVSLKQHIFFKFLSTLITKVTWWLNILIHKLLCIYLSFKGNLQTFYANVAAVCMKVMLNLIYDKLLMDLFFQ